MANHDDQFTTEALVPGFTPPVPPIKRPTPDAIEAADRISRFWTSTLAGPLSAGSEAHKHEFSRMFRDTFNPYRPSVIFWPKLGSEALERLTSLPIWDIAVQTEGRARLNMATYAGTIRDPDLRAAIALNAWEENRHKEVLSRLVETYGIKLATEPSYRHPRDPEWAYLITGYSECIDSFFAFGLFALARRSAFFPPELVETFEPVMQEECRHILLFANWVAWHRANLPWFRRVFFELRVAAVWVFLGWERIGLARGMDGQGHETQQDNNFTVNGGKAVSSVEISVLDLLGICLAENDRRFAGYDARLRRPTTTPSLARICLRVGGLWSRKRRSGRVRAES